MKDRILVMVCSCVCALVTSCVFGQESDVCEQYCDQAEAACTGTNEIFASRSACLQACGDISDGGQEGDTKGDSLQCRIYHLEAAELDPLLHCAHGSPDGGGVCVDEPSACDRYCALINEKCSLEATVQYESTRACLNACAAFTPDEVMCRQGFLGNEFPGDMSEVGACQAAGAESVECGGADAGEDEDGDT